ncbi:LysR family transcriptional regulator [Naumannella halotolerans]|uniref:LysR family transcriptional regulator n=1 Tax=Naumannella halotolerans TaxID=993414 RepID=UPI00370D7322
MDRRQLTHFLAVAHAGSLTRAAAHLRIAQPSLSHSIRALETELGTQLFQRLGRGVALTPAGEALVEPAARTLRAFEIAASTVRSVDNDEFGTLRIIGSTLWALTPLVPLVTEFRRLMPNVRVSVSDPEHRDDVLEQVRTGRVDLGLLEGPPPAGRFASQYLADLELLAVLPPNHARSVDSETPVTIEELAEIGLISTPTGTALRTHLDQRLDLADRSGQVQIETAHLAALVPLVLSGAGAALLPEGMAATAIEKGATVVGLAPPSLARVSLIWRAGQLDPRSRTMLTLAREFYGTVETDQSGEL